MPAYAQDDAIAAILYDLPEQKVLPEYYDDPDLWQEMIKQGMKDIIPQFDSNRMARKNYEMLYS